MQFSRSGWHRVATNIGHRHISAADDADDTKAPMKIRGDW